MQLAALKGAATNPGWAALAANHGQLNDVNINERQSGQKHGS
jgi:hypothetical protein